MLALCDYWLKTEQILFVDANHRQQLAIHEGAHFLPKMLT